MTKTDFEQRRAAGHQLRRQRRRQRRQRQAVRAVKAWLTTPWRHWRERRWLRDYVRRYAAAGEWERKLLHPGSSLAMDGAL